MKPREGGRLQTSNIIGKLYGGDGKMHTKVTQCHCWPLWGQTQCSSWNYLRCASTNASHIFWELNPFPPTWQKHCIMKWVFWAPHFCWASLQVENLVLPVAGNLFYSDQESAVLHLNYVNVMCGRVCVCAFVHVHIAFLEPAMYFMYNKPNFFE